MDRTAPRWLKLMLGQAAERRAQHLAIEPFLALEMIVDRGLIDPRPRDNGADAGAVIAALGKQPLGRLQ